MFLIKRPSFFCGVHSIIEFAFMPVCLIFVITS